MLYSSGTTGLPKAIVHGHGGILLEQLKKSLHLDLRPGDRMFWFTTTGWMMWNFLVGCLLSDAAIVLYDGSPGHPDLGVLWDLAERAEITCMGVSAGLLASCEKAGIEPGRDYDLKRPARDRLDRLAAGAGELQVGLRARRIGHLAVLDQRRHGRLHGVRRRLPAAARCTRANCNVVRSAARWRPGTSRAGASSTRSGELVITEPLPSMPLFFWGDDGGERLRESYFAMYPGIWRHGDWIRITPRGGAVIYGRSDSTINRQGVRMGTSEIYRAAGAVEEVLDALVVDIPGATATASCGWCCSWCCAQGVALDDELTAQIKRRIREDCSPRHVPNEILQIEQVPRTLSGKVLEVPVKRILMGAPPHEAASVDSLANPALARLLRGARQGARRRGRGRVPRALRPLGPVASRLQPHRASDDLLHDLVGAAVDPASRGRRRTRARSGTRACSRSRRAAAGSGRRHVPLQVGAPPLGHRRVLGRQLARVERLRAAVDERPARSRFRCAPRRA